VLDITTEGFGSPTWVASFEAIPDGDGPSVAIDPAGDVITAGVAVKVGRDAVFVTKHARATGIELWSAGVEIGEADVDAVQLETPVLATDAGSDVYVAGIFQSSETGTNPGSIAAFGSDLPATQDAALYVAKLDPSGALLWLREVQTYQQALPGEQLGVSGIAATPDGGVVLALAYAGQFQAADGTILAATGVDALVEQLDASGSAVWTRAFAGPGTQYATGVAVAGNGDIVVGGELSGSATFGSGSPVAAPSGEDAWLARLGADGALAWQQALGSDAAPVVSGPIALGADGHIVTGYATFGVDGRTQFPVLAQYDGDGEDMWRTAPVPAVPGGGTPLQAAVRADGTVVTLGTIEDHAIDLGTGPVAGTSYLAAYDPTGASGTLPAAVGYGGALTGLAVGADGAVVFAGKTLGPMDFGTGTAVPAGFVVVRLDPPAE
jgi:hypothetical protein